MTNKTKNIDALNFLDFVQLTEAAKEEGYVFDFSTIATAPQNLGFRYFAVMVKGSKNVYPEAKKKDKPEEKVEAEVKDEVVETPEVEQDEQNKKDQPQQRGRKPNSAK